MNSLKERLIQRNTESEQQLQLRLSNAQKELDYGRTEGNFDEIIVNDDLEVAVNELNVFLHDKYESIFR